MKKYLCIVALAFVACHNEREVRAGDRGDNIGSQMTSRAPGAPPVATNPNTLLSKESVQKVQTALRDRGFVVEKNGTLDAKTQTALRSFQRREGIATTGMPDQLTIRKLNLQPEEILRANPVKERERLNEDDQSKNDYDSGDR